MNDQLDGHGKPATFQPGDRVFVGAIQLPATVIRQQMCWDGPDCFWGNVELLYDDDIKGTANSWQLQKL